MIRHLLRLIWNRKRKNVLLIAEVCLAFLVLFAVLTMVIYNWMNYQKPMGFSHENVWTLESYFNESYTEQEIKEKQLLLKKELEAFDEIEMVANCRANTPFGGSNWNWAIEWQGRSVKFNHFVMDPSYFDILQMETVQGRFFTEDDIVERPIVITKALAEEMFPDVENPVGEKITSEEIVMNIVGVIDMYRYQSEFAEPSSGVFERYEYDDPDTYPENGILIKVKEGVGVAFEEELLRSITASIPDCSIQLYVLDDLRNEKRIEAMLPITIFLIISVFLIFNVALGLFGVLWYNVNSRKAEIGLRRAMGASSNAIVKQIMGETFLLVSIAMLIGIVLAVQVPMLHLFDIAGYIYIIAILVSVIFLYSIVVFCSWYPGKKASEIMPAIALHEN